MSEIYFEKLKRNLYSGKITNISSILVFKTKSHVILIPDEKLTYIKKILSIRKKDLHFEYLDKNVFLDIKKKYYFSFLIGFIKLQKKIYMIFAEKVKVLKIREYKIFKIKNIVVINLLKFKVNSNMTLILNNYFKKGFYFSYDIDLTYSKNFFNIFKDKKNKKIEKKFNWFFFINQNLIYPLINRKAIKWFNPLIYGKIKYEIIQINEKNKIEILLIKKEMINNLFSNYNKNKEFYEQIFCPKKMTNFDIFLNHNNNLKALSISFNKMNNYFKDLMADLVIGDYFKSFFNINKIQKYFQFFFDFMSIKNFFLCLDDKTNKLVKKFREKFKKNLYDFHINSIEIIEKYNEEAILNIIKKSIKYYNKEESKWINLSISLRKFNEFANKNLKILILYYIKNHIPKDSKLKFEKIISKFFTKIEKKKSIIKRFKFEIRETIQSEKSPFQNINEIYHCLFGSEKTLYKNIINLNKKHSLPIISLSELQIAIITHNCSGITPNEKIRTNYLEKKEIKNSDIIILGLQEIVEMKIKNLKSIITNDNDFNRNKWLSYFEKKMSEFEIVARSSLLGLFMIVFVRRNICREFDVALVKHKLFKLGFMKFANKGGIYFEINVNSDRIGFLNCHLESGEKKGNFVKRIEQIKKFEEYVKNRKKLNLVFIFGDMNFRNKQNWGKIKKLINNFKNINDEMIKNILLGENMKTDELTSFRSEQNIGFLKS